MGFKDCLNMAALRGAISEGNKEAALKLFDQMERDLKNAGLSEDAARAKAAAEATEFYRKQSAGKKKALVLALTAKQRGEAAINLAGDRPVQGLTDTLILSERKAALYKQRLAGIMDKFFDRYAKGNFLGNFFRDESDRDMLGREMMGQSSGSKEHREFAEQVKKVNHDIVKRSNDAGAHITERENYGLPTAHDAVALNKAGFEKFFDDVTNPASPMRWGLDKMTDLEGRKLSTYSPDELRQWATRMFDSVKSDSWTKASRGTSNLAESISKRRFVEFGGYDQWKAYNKKYGLSGGDPVSAIESHINTGARDVSMLEQFGPNPRASINYLRDYAMKKAGTLTAADRSPRTGKAATELAKTDMSKFNAIYDAVMGNENPVTTWGAAYGTARNFIYAAKIIPQAFLSQATVDPLFRIPNLKMQYNLPTMSVLRNYMEYLPSLVSKDRRMLALRLGVAGEDILNSLHSNTIMRDHPIYAKTQTLSDFMGRAFAVNAHMHVLPQIMARDILANLASWKGMKFDELPIAAALKREGINALDWDEFRKTPTFAHKGVDYLVPNDMLDRTDVQPTRAREVGEKFGLFVNGAARETVPAFNPKTRYALYGNYDPNSLAGMIVRDKTMATYFTASTAAMLMRGFQLRQGLGSKIGYAAAATTTLLMANAMRMQAKALAAGRDPYNMNPATKNGREFWLENAATSGFAGPGIDLLNPDNHGGVTDLISNIGTASYHEIRHLTGQEPKDPNFRGKIFNIARHMLPGADGWYTKLLVQHMALDQIQREIDPKAHISWNKSERFYQNNFGQREWWQPGAPTPTRAPNIGAAWQSR